MLRTFIESVCLCVFWLFITGGDKGREDDFLQISNTRATKMNMAVPTRIVGMCKG